MVVKFRQIISVDKIVRGLQVKTFFHFGERANHNMGENYQKINPKRPFHSSVKSVKCVCQNKRHK
jgi:hypothetical protein